MLNSSQTVVASYTSDAFGNTVSSSGSSANPFIWNGGSGYYSDAESGLQKVGARYYDPVVGRWISQDTAIVAGSPADSQAVNRYAYCEGSPVGASDGSGHANWALFFKGMGEVAAGKGLLAAAKLRLDGAFMTSMEAGGLTRFANSILEDAEIAAAAAPEEALEILSEAEGMAAFWRHQADELRELAIKMINEGNAFEARGEAMISAGMKNIRDSGVGGSA